MPDTLVIELARQVPGTVCVILTVLMFIRFLLRIAERVDAVEQRRDTFLRETAETCHDFQREIADRTEKHFARVAEALNHNTDSMIRNTVALERIERKAQTTPLARATEPSP